MNISQLQKILSTAKSRYGNVPVMLMDSETGDRINIAQIIKLHPYTGQYGCMNRKEPVNAIMLSSYGNNAKDLVLS